MTPPRAHDAKREVSDERTRTRRAMTASVILHVIVLLAIVLAPDDTPDAAPLVEITLESAPAEAGAPAPAPAPGETQAASQDHFRRERRTGEVRPDDVIASDVDRLAARLANMRTETAPQAVGFGSATPTPSSAPLPAVVGGVGSGGSAPLSLRRGSGAGPGPGLEMARGAVPGAGAGGGLAPATAPTRSTAAEAPAGESGDGGARRMLAGASLAGPIADRPILSFVKPVYPDWAKRDAVEGTVTLYFVVRPDGTVKENVLVQRTAGFEEFDENARVALRAWKFQPLRDGRSGEQWGTITFRYRLEGGS